MGIAGVPRMPGVPRFMCRARDLAHVGRDGRGEKQHRNREHQDPSKHRIASIARHSSARRKRSALLITDTELNVIAALAIIGLSSSPNHGYRMPAAIGTPATL